MAFNFDKGSDKKMAYATPRAEPPQTFEKAKSLAVGKHVAKQIDNYKNNKLIGPKGKPLANNWMRKDLNGQWWISFRIKSKLIYFTDTVEANGGWIPSDDVVGDLEAIRDEVASGKWDKQAKEALYRLSEREKRLAAKAAEEAAMEE